MTERRYPVADLARAMSLSESALFARLGVSGTEQRRHRDIGMSRLVADRMAVKAGLHPFEVWPEMADHDLADAEQIEAARLERRRARQRQYAAKRRQNPSYVARQREYAAGYRATYSDGLKAQRRRYYERNRGRELARQREYDATVRKARRLARKDAA